MEADDVRYMMLIAGEGVWDGLTEAEQQALYGRIREWWDARVAAGEITEGHELQPAETATTVRRLPDGQVTVTDGPFVEGKEVVGGYAILAVPDLDAAIRLASEWPAPGTLEIRPVVEGNDGGM
jgi:hypothetical protein